MEIFNFMGYKNRRKKINTKKINKKYIMFKVDI